MLRGNDKAALGHVPTRLVDDQDGMGTGRDGCSDLRKVQVHRRGIAIFGAVSDPRPCPPSGRDGTENIGVEAGALICGSAGAGATLVAQRRVILFFWPMRASSWNRNLYAFDAEPRFVRDFIQARGKFF